MKVTKQQIVILICMLLIGILLTQLCKRPQVTVTPNHKATIDSLITVNKAVTRNYQRLADSIDRVIKGKDKMYADGNKKLQDITVKYIALRSAAPDRDTVVKIVEIYDGRECIEKMPVIQGQLVIANSKIADLKNKVVICEQHNYLVQEQFDKSIALNAQQLKENKKLKRKVRWQRVAMIGEAVGILTLVAIAAAQ